MSTVMQASATLLPTAAALEPSFALQELAPPVESDELLASALESPLEQLSLPGAVTMDITGVENAGLSAAEVRAPAEGSSSAEQKIAVLSRVPSAAPAPEEAVRLVVEAVVAQGVDQGRVEARAPLVAAEGRGATCASGGLVPPVALSLALRALPEGYPLSEENVLLNAEETAQPLDAIVINALAVPRDRALLLLAEAELERFLFDPTVSRLPLSPPWFPPQLNSYQRLLIHRLADTFGIRREVEAVHLNWPGNAPATASGILVLVKGPGAKLPPTKLASYGIPSTPSALRAIPLSPNPIALAPVDLSLLTLVSDDVSSTLSPAPVVAPPRFFKILSRVAPAPSSSSASSAVDDSDDPTNTRLRREMSLEERETAYKEARERIFQGQNGIPASESAPLPRIRPSSPDSTYSRSTSASSPSNYPALAQSSNPPLSSGYASRPIPPPGAALQPHWQQPLTAGNLRPAAPSFTPQGPPRAGYSTWAYATTSYSSGERVTRESVYQESYTYSDSEYSRGTGGSGYQSRNGAGSFQPPIQVTAPSPLPQPAPYRSNPAHQQHQNGSYSDSPWSSRANLSSTSSGSSSHYPAAPSNNNFGQEPLRASGHDSPGYLMRFSDGAVIYPVASSISSSTGTRSSSTSRTASTTSLRASMTGSSHHSAAPLPRRISHSTSTSLSSSAVSARGPLSSSSGSVGGRLHRSPSIGTSRSGSSIAGSDAGTAASGGTSAVIPGPGPSTSTSGQDLSRVETASPTSVAGGKGKGKEVNSGHPGLPAKPTWSAIAASTYRTGSGAQLSSMALPSQLHPRPPSNHKQFTNPPSLHPHHNSHQSSGVRPAHYGAERLSSSGPPSRASSAPASRSTSAPAHLLSTHDTALL